MRKQLLILILISQLFHACSIPGAYYLVNLTDASLNVRLGYEYSFENLEIKSTMYEGEALEYDDFDEMLDHSYVFDTLSCSVIFTLEPNTYAFIGYGSNHRSYVDVIDIAQIQKPMKINEGDNDKVSISSARMGSYIGVVTIDEVDEISNTLPPDGVYTYDIAFAEWGGKSMGDKVEITIKNRSVEVRYDGGGQLPLAEKGDLLETGILVRHKTGEWIIVRSQGEINTEEIGGCTGGPSIIDFDKQKFWMC
ncbi:hypothetical protein [Lewinella cohaerens]|uniref:hypothetical protein n=1 Tax=Lewinella cohaerens TaxID=70995 RepID=UPI0003692458|nr:hypothetical protein [Lewinella cohaerens]